MRISVLSALTVALAAEATVASSWFYKAAYNKWHETELERWLSDHNVPYPTPADRKDLVDLVKNNWNDYVVYPYNNWDTKQLQSFLAAKGLQTKESSKQGKDSLVAEVKQNWYETEDQATDAYNSVKDWIFDTWTDSQLKAFCDRNGIPVPQPRTRDSLLKTVRENYQTVANKLGETAAYPGDWLWESWSNSEAKAWLDERGYPVPQPTSRDKLIASLRRNSRLASLRSQDYAASLSASAAAATNSLTDALIDAWGDSQLKEWLDKNGVKVPQGSRRNELVALVRKHRAKLTGDRVADKASSYYGAATSSAGNEYAQATREAALRGNQAMEVVWGYVDWIKGQLGLLSGEAKASASSASAHASKSASSVAAKASKASNSASVKASKAAEKSGQAAADAAKDKANKASKYVQEEL